jgi:hypothetical protein
MERELSLMEKLKMISFLQANLNNAPAIINAYREEPEKWEALKEQYPIYKSYIAKYPNLVKQLEEAGIDL